MTDRELLQQALDALEKLASQTPTTHVRAGKAQFDGKEHIALWFDDCSDPIQQATYINATKPEKLKEFLQLVRARLAQPEPEPVVTFEGDKLYWISGRVNKDPDLDGYLYTAPPQRARLAQPENEFNPDWNAMAVMVEEQQRMAKRIEELETKLAQPEPDAYGYATRLAEAIYQKHYKEDSPEWRPLDTTLGVLTQIDNMTCRLVKTQPEPPCKTGSQCVGGKCLRCAEPEPVACPKEPANIEELYTAPPQREWKGLTDEEIMAMRHMRDWTAGWTDIRYAREIEAKLREKNT